VRETPASYFEQRWAASDDPWDHAGRWYEARKYDLTIAALPRLRYRHVVEPACGAGVLTVRLSDRADLVTASDRFPPAVAVTEARCRGLTNVTTEVRDLRAGPPPSPYDLAVLSECLYYFPLAEVIGVVRAWHGGCAPDGHLELVHYRRPVAEHVFTGDEVHAVARDLLGEPVVELCDSDFLLAVFGAPG
jgi:hypothetical protein